MKNNLWREITQVVCLTAVVFFSTYFFVPGVANAIDAIGEGYKLLPGVTRPLTIHDIVCKEITSAGSRTVFLPTRTPEEYDAFLAHKPSDVTITNCAVPDPCDTVSVTWGGETYGGVRLGEKCWMDRNLNYGTLLGSTQYPTNNGIAEKMCPGNVESGCSDGALYTLEEAVNYSFSEGAQGICPPGWHVPTEAEFELLIQTEADPLPTTQGAIYSALGPGSEFDGRLTGQATWAGWPTGDHWNYADAGIYAEYYSSTNCDNCNWPTNGYKALKVTSQFPSANVYELGTVSYNGNPLRCVMGTYSPPPPIN